MDFRNLDLNLLQVLEAVDRAGSVTRVAPIPIVPSL
jgi:hypothetical protein